MSININIDRVKLRNSIYDILLTLDNINFGGVEEVDIDIKYGWIYVNYKGFGYSKVSSNTPVMFGSLSNYQAITISATYYIIDLFNTYVLFVERAPGDANMYYHGFYLGSSGTLAFRHYPGKLGGGNTSAVINAGDIILLRTTIGNRDGTLYWMAGAFRYNWDSDSTELLFSNYGTIGPADQMEKYRYLCIVEQNASAGKIAFTSVAINYGRLFDPPSEGPNDPDTTLAKLRQLRRHGLQDPRTITW